VTAAALLPDELTASLQALFDCPGEAAEALRRRATERRAGARDLILRQGDGAGEAFVLLRGRAQALSYGSEGQLTLVQEYGPGDVFGALGPADPPACDADVVALEPCRLAVVAGADLAQLVERHGSLGLALSRALLRQLRGVTGRMVARTTLSATGRVHAELLRLAREGDGRTVRPAPVLSALAVRVQTTRETVSRTIHALDRRGVIRLDPDALVIVAPRRLEDMIV
jgi:CRP-like cAMP-binding protein